MSPADDAPPAPGVSAPAVSAPERWIEPTRLLPLRWGRYDARVIAGLALIMLGTLLIQLTSAYSLPLLAIGCAAQPAGWALMPTTIGRRVAVVVPVLGFTWLMLGGSAFAWCFAVPLGAWLLVRSRPPLSYVVLILPIVGSVILTRIAPDYSLEWLSITISALVTIAAAWLARLLAIQAARWAKNRARSREAISRNSAATD